MAEERKKQIRERWGDTVTGIGWANGRQACLYAGIGLPTLRRWLEDGLPHSRIGGLLRIKYSDIDEYIRRYQVAGQPVEATSRTVKSILAKVI
jgi:excisionase family DNA binding protein